MEQLTLNDFQTRAGTYQLPTAPPEERIFGLIEEVGEVAAIFKRLLRGDYQDEEAGKKLIKELGDVLWYLSRIAADNDTSLQEVADACLSKLESRKTRNLIIGSGDDR